MDGSSARLRAEQGDFVGNLEASVEGRGRERREKKNGEIGERGEGNGHGRSVVERKLGV